MIPATSDALHGLSLKALEPRDLDAVVELITVCDHSYLEWSPQGWSPPHPDAYNAKWAKRLLDVERWTQGAFGSDGALIAMAAAPQEMAGAGEEPASRPVQVEALFVRPSRWGEGIGGAMLEMAERALCEEGHGSARLLTPEGAPAQSFYERCGWTLTGRREFKKDFGMWMLEYEKHLT